MSERTDLVIWRHGRTAWNESGRFQGHLDPPLDDVGRREVAAAVPSLLALRPAAIVSSDLVRAASTAAVLGAAVGLPVDVDARLREVDVGDWGGLTRAEIAARWPEAYGAWLGGEDVRRGSGETLAEAGTRAVDAVADRLATAGRPLVVVTHGGTGRMLMLRLLGLPDAARTSFAVLGNARWAALAEGRTGWRLAAYGAGVDVVEGDERATE